MQSRISVFVLLEEDCCVLFGSHFSLSLSLAVVFLSTIHIIFFFRSTHYSFWFWVHHHATRRYLTVEDFELVFIHTFYTWTDVVMLLIIIIIIIKNKNNNDYSDGNAEYCWLLHKQQQPQWWWRWFCANNL